jgi:hypothetical protein
MSDNCSGTFTDLIVSGELPNPDLMLRNIRGSGQRAHDILSQGKAVL